MEEEEDEEMEEAVELQYPRKLDFNAPLLSTRRPGGYNGAEMSCTNSQAVSRDTSDRIPFSWEQVPGKPKDTERIDTPEGDTPRPRLPPSRWHLLRQTTNDDDDKDHNHALRDHNDDDCDGDVDDDDDEDDVFSDAIDVFSLTEAIDIVEKAQKVHGLDKSMLESVESSYNESPNYMIKRFLPAANALAASSVLAASKNLNRKLPYPCSYPEAQVASRSYSSHKGCGLDTFFPWRTKHKLCGIKSPVRQGSPNMPPQCSLKQKNTCSLADRPFGCD